MNWINELYNIIYFLSAKAVQIIYLLEPWFLISYIFGSYFFNSLSFKKQYELFEKLPITTSYHHEYNKIWVLLIIALAICFLLFLLSYIFSFSTIKDSEKLSEYECGFEPFDNATRHPFDVHFYIVGILFLIFDVEIALLFPWVLSLHHMDSWFSFYIMIIFLGLLTIGFFYEWHRGALVWPHQQYSTIFTDYRENLG
jgi:NADH-quinone oxidoreductase subunit A